MKEKREIILFFTRLLMLAVMLAVLFGVIFGMTLRRIRICPRKYVPEICSYITGWNGNIPTGMLWYFKKRGHCIQGVLWRERKIR